MATLLSQVKRGKIQKPHLLLLYGIDGCGKSTFGSQAPAPIFLGSEEGTNNMDVARFPSVTNWSDVNRAILELQTGEHQFKTLVIDSLDWLEPILYQAICDRHGAKSIDFAAGGYGKGYTDAVNEWQKFCRTLSTLRDVRKMNIILIAHSEVIKFSDPSTQSEYDRHQLKLYKKSAAVFREFVDAVLFANFQVFSKKEGGKTRAYGDGARVIYTERRPGWDAKNRFGLDPEIPLSFEEYERAVFADKTDDPEKLKESIVAMIEEIKLETTKTIVLETVEKAGNSAAQLLAIKNRLITVLEEQE